MSAVEFRIGDKNNSAPQRISDNVVYRGEYIKVLALLLVVFGIVSPFILTPSAIPYIVPWGCVLSGSASIVAAVLLLKISKKVARGRLRLIDIDQDDLSGVTFGGEMINISWKEVSKVNIGAKHINVVTPNTFLSITCRFPRFPLIVNVVRRICQEKGIQCNE